MRSFDIPAFYRSPVISKLKKIRREKDLRKEDASPALLDFGPVRFFIARHFGFCFGVENAIEIAFRAVAENPGKRIFLLSQMIHNPEVNKNLQERGVRYLMDTSGNRLIPFSELSKEDIVIIPAFGITLELEHELQQAGTDIKKYNTTCPFVERVWKRAEQLGSNGFSVVIHGKNLHEETRATFSRSAGRAPSIVIRDFEEAKRLGEFMLGNMTREEFNILFAGRFSEQFNPEKDLEKIGVINQTTMLASETQAIADYLKQVMIKKYGAANSKDHFFDSRDTLCYATNENQEATYGLLKQKADLAIVVGGYNSSNTSHIVELCEKKFSTFFISSAKEIVSKNRINHFIYGKQQHTVTEKFIPGKNPVDIILTSGASCPDSLVDEVLQKICSFFPAAKPVNEVMNELEKALNADLPL